jgi:hypothetical protein
LFLSCKGTKKKICGDFPSVIVAASLLFVHFSSVTLYESWNGSAYLDMPWRFAMFKNPVAIATQYKRQHLTYKQRLDLKEGKTRYLPWQAKDSFGNPPLINPRSRSGRIHTLFSGSCSNQAPQLQGFGGVERFRTLPKVKQGDTSKEKLN